VQFYLHPELTEYFDTSKPLFEQLMALKGDVYRSQKGRITQRITLGNKTYFIKQHLGVGWKEIIKNLLFGRLPVLGAKNEWQALQKLHKLNVHAPGLLAYGERGLNPATRESFVLMEDVTPAMSLEDLCRDWCSAPVNVKLKRNLIQQVAKIARILHEQGINHRDFYICHFLLAESHSTDLSLYLIDLHRAQIRSKTPLRWVIKDLAGLYFSSKDIGLTKHDYLRFMSIYRQASLREITESEHEFWQKVKNSGNRLYRHHQA
jgi:tRNA A-37 threonylcarbamoyl transferase component Bud32